MLLLHYVELLRAEAARQNLIARSTLNDVWHRHILDSLQLLPLAPVAGLWLDVGSGAGLPGLVVAIARRAPTILLEPRARRAAFLQQTCDTLGLDHVRVVAVRAEALAPAGVSIISARAVAPLPALFAMARRHAAPDCVWLLPKGRSAAEELATARRTWQGDFTLIPSETDPEASIVMARDVRPEPARRPSR